MPNPTEPLTANEAASVTQVPLKQVHRIIDSGLLLDGVQLHSGTRLIFGRALIGLRLAHLTADTLTLDARRRVIRRVLEEPKATSVQDDAVSVAVAPVAVEVSDGLATLERAKAMVSNDPTVMGGAPCVAGTRLPVHMLADMVANGDRVDAVTAAYPPLTDDQVRLACVYATAYPRRGRPPAKPAWRKNGPSRSKILRLDDLPQAS
jgi:uncharacterized protein (DUF433 family)